MSVFASSPLPTLLSAERFAPNFTFVEKLGLKSCPLTPVSFLDTMLFHGAQNCTCSILSS